MKFLIVLIGIIIRPFAKHLRVTKNLWIIGSHDGTNYDDNSKYLFEHIQRNHPEINAIWITRSATVIKKLKQKGYKVYHNLSITGLWYSFTAEVVVFCIMRSDLIYISPKKNRKIVNLFHGMPMKKIAYDHEPHKPENRNWKGILWDKLVVLFRHEDVALVPVTSDFFANIFKSAFNTSKTVVTGQARTDVFYKWDKSEIKKKLGFKNDEKIITYMPTHRAYGKGEMNPRIFENNPEAISYFKENNIKVVWKFHRNMYNNYKPNINGITETFADLTPKNVDSQELIFATDILITDYSSCYIDFLILKRPVIFYLYDNYESEDNELYYSPHQHNVGDVCFSEKELLHSIQNPRLFESDLYHKYNDSLSCERIIEKLK